MNLDLIALITMLIVMSLFGIGIVICIIITWFGNPKTYLEQYHEDLEQMNYLKSKKKNK